MIKEMVSSFVTEKVKEIEYSINNKIMSRIGKFS